MKKKMDYKDGLLESWELNNKVTLYLLEHLDSDWLKVKLLDRGRSIGDQFVHINNIRSYWIGKVGEKIDLKLDKKSSVDKVKLIDALRRSSKEMFKTLSNVLEEETIKGFKPHAFAFFAQMIAHESHHRGQIMATVTRNNLPISKSVNFGLWSWSKK